MLRSVVCMLAVLIWLVPTAQAETALRGVNIYVHTPDYNDHDDLRERLTEVHERLSLWHVNAVALTWPIFVTSVTGNQVYAGDRTPAIDDLRIMIEFFSQNNYHVTLRPTIDERNITLANPVDWRGTIRPDGVDVWFLSYRLLLRQYAELGEEAGAHALSIGVELTSMERYSQQWLIAIADVRDRFNGLVTYNSNRGIAVTIPWEDLDYIAVSGFFDIDVSPDAAVQQIVTALGHHRDELVTESVRIGLPLVLGEVGTTSQRGSFNRPWRWDHRTGLDSTAQARYIEAVCTVWFYDLMGLYWWHIGLHPPATPHEDQTFDITGKPDSEAALRSCFSSSRSE